MENPKTRILEKIVHRNYHFCCLCFRNYEQDQTGLDDEVVLFEDELGTSQKVSHMVSYVLGESALVDISTFQALCVQCTTSVANCYKFIKGAQENLQYLNTAVENLSCCFVHEPDDIDDYNSLFIAVNHDISVGNQYYHSNITPIQNKKEVLETFQTITGIKEEKEQAIQKKKGKPEFKTKVKISTTEMIHGQELQCKECFKQFNSVPNLRNHFLRVHATKQFKCPQCPKSYSTESLLKTHRANSHIVVVCSECGKSFNNIYSLKIHEKGHFMKYVCPDCGRVYKNQNTYKKHFDNNICQRESRHSPTDAKFTCDYCGKKYTQKISLRVHIQYEHGNKKYIECEWCDKKFWCQSRLKAHIVKHTKEKNFGCTICGGKFVTKESLLYHTRIHTGEKPYACQYCDSKFLSASRRISHIKSHHMDSSVECEICHSRFKTAHYLTKHKKIHEKQDKIQKIDAEKNTEDETIQLQFSEKNTKPEIKTYGNRNNSVLKTNEVKKIVYNVVEQDPNVFELQIGADHSKKSLGKIEFLLVDSNNEEVTQESVVDQSNEQVFYKVEGNDEYIIKLSENVK